MSGGTGGILLVSLNWIVPVPVVMWINNQKHTLVVTALELALGERNETTIVPLPFRQQIVE
jgi:hypothetical protein